MLRVSVTIPHEQESKFGKSQIDMSIIQSQRLKIRVRLWHLAVITILGCWLLSLVLHNPVPRIHDEFSYVLMGETFALGHAKNPAPQLPEFFDTFHVLIHPAYVSKYFPVQGLFLALGDKLGAKPALGVWLSSALAVAALVWMLEAWISPNWALLGGIIVVLQYGIYSYWSQTYWGGMATAMGGGLFFGALRRLWSRFSWQNSIWLALSLVILANSRPLEGALATLPGTILFAYQIAKNRRRHESGFWPMLVLPCVTILALGIFATGSYNRMITGSALKPPYMLHEAQYQESPPFIFLPKRPQLTYTSVWLRYYYEFQELHTYDMQRSFEAWTLAIARKLYIWWAFYCGILLSIPLFVSALLKKGRVRFTQIVFLAGFLMLPLITDHKVAWRVLIDLLVPLEIGVLWVAFDDLWSRLALITCSLLFVEISLAKWPFPHYFAPAACLIWYLEIEGLRRIWLWTSQAQPEHPLTRAEGRRLARQKSRAEHNWNIRGLVYALPILCVVSLALRIKDRMDGHNSDPHGPDRGTLVQNDWAVRRADLNRWLELQSTPQLVFVRYSRWHNVNDEWVYNHPDIMHSHVIWARDLGAEHNKLLVNLLSDRTKWLLQADAPEPQLVPYAQAETVPSSSEGPPGKAGIGPEPDEQMN